MMKRREYFEAATDKRCCQEDERLGESPCVGRAAPISQVGAHPLLGSCTMVPGALGELTIHAVLYITGQWLAARCPKPRKAQTSRSRFQSDCPHQGGDPGLRSVQILMS